MQYTFDSLGVKIPGYTWDKNSGKEVLQYAVGGLLYVPASNQTIADKIISGSCPNIKSLVLDLEDSLGDDLVGLGEKNIEDILNRLVSAIERGEMGIEDLPLIFIRVREPKQMKRLYQVLGKNMEFISGFNLPKFDKSTCDSFISSFCDIKAKVNSDLYIMPIIESSHVMYRQLRMDNLIYINDAIRPIASNVLNIRVGGADFCNIFGLRRPVDATIYEIGPVRDCLNDILNVFGKSYVVSAPVWEYFGKHLDEPWASGLRQEISSDRLNGFIGKTCIHPSQLPIVQQSLIVSNEDYMDAYRIFGMSSNIEGVKKGELGGRMNEVKTHSRWAKKTIGLAIIYGVRQ